MKKIFTIFLVLSAFLSYSQSTTLVISQLYGAGGNTGALLDADYVELHNVSGVSISLSGYTIQYGSSAVTGIWTGVAPLPAVSIPAGGYYLIQMSAAGANGSPLPTPDHVATPSIAMAAANGRVALVNGLIALSACPTSASYVDFVGYGTATCFEGTGPTAAISTILAAFRNNSGCTDTNNNAADFTVATPAPRNSATSIFACGAIAPSLTVTGTVTDFGNVFIGSNSASQTYSISGANLTGAPGVITITAPSTDFQVSNDNTIWGSSTTVAYSSATLTATPVWVRFSPQSAGPKSGNVSNAGGGVSAAVTVAVSGNGEVPATPVLSATTLNPFGNVCVNSMAGPNSFTVNGINLTAADISVGPLAGFSFSTVTGGPYTASITVNQPGGTFSQQVFVQFTPVATQSYNGNIPVAGAGATTVLIAASGAGANNPPSVTTGAASAITITTATIAGSITDAGCTAVTVYGLEYSLTSGFPNGSGTQVVSTNLASGDYSVNLTGLTPSTIYYYKAYATNGGGTTYGAQQSFTTATPVLTATTLAAFGSICVNASSAENAFTVNSAGLTATNVTVGPLAGYSFSTAAAGTYTASLNLTQPGGVYSQIVYVKLTPLAIQSYNGNIPVGGGGAIAISVAASGSGYNARPIVITGTSTVLNPNKATLAGSIADNGCSAITGYGVEYSGIDGFANGHGIKAYGSNLAGIDYTVSLNNLVQATTYYYKAFAINNGGISYGAQEMFTTDTLPTGLIIYSSPIVRGGNMRYSLNSIKPGHYQTKIFNQVGQLVYQREVVIQVNFIDENFILPYQLGTGLYTLQVFNHEFKVNKSFLIY